MKTLLFVYGTLKRGLHNHHYLSGQHFVGEAKTLPRYRLYHFDVHPGMIENLDGGLEVHGEIFEVEADALAVIDDFEEVPHHFIRKPVLLQGVFKPVDAYFYNHPLKEGAVFSDRWPFPS